MFASVSLAVRPDIYKHLFYLCYSFELQEKYIPNSNYYVPMRKHWAWNNHTLSLSLIPPVSTVPI